jgi:hypothetical protein
MASARFGREDNLIRCQCDDLRWCAKVGTVVNNGISKHVRVWVSSDGALVLPFRADGETRAVVGSRIRTLGNILNVCTTGDMGTISGIRENSGDAPRSWFVVLDGGCDSYFFDGEFEVA